MIRRNFIQFSKVYQFVVPSQRLEYYIITFKLVSRTFFEEVLSLKLSDNSYMIPRSQIFVNNNFEVLGVATVAPKLYRGDND